MTKQISMDNIDDQFGEAIIGFGGWFTPSGTETPVLELAMRACIVLLILIAARYAIMKVLEEMALSFFK